MMQENIAAPSCKLNDPRVRIVWSYIAQYALKLFSVSDITYEEVKGYKSKGRPKKDEEKVTVSVIVRANAQIDTEAVKNTVEKATYYVLCTNDTEHKLAHEWFTFHL